MLRNDETPAMYTVDPVYPKCALCKYWYSGTFTRDEQVCNHPKMTGREDSGNGIIFVGDEASWDKTHSLAFPADFGCIHFEAKE